MAIALGHEPAKVIRYSDQRLQYIVQNQLEKGTKKETARLAKFAEWDADSKNFPMRDVNEMVRMAREAEDAHGYRKWYQQLKQAVSERSHALWTRSEHNPYETDLDLFIRLLTVTSGLTKVETNVLFAQRAFSLIAQGRGQEIKQMSFGTANADPIRANIVRIMAGEELPLATQAKFHSFRNNLMGDLDSGTVDQFASVQVGFDKAPTPMQRRYVIDKYQQVADRLGWDVAEVQATLWPLDKVGKPRPDAGGAGNKVIPGFAPDATNVEVKEARRLVKPSKAKKMGLL